MRSVKVSKSLSRSERTSPFQSLRRSATAFRNRLSERVSSPALLCSKTFTWRRSKIKSRLCVFFDAGFSAMSSLTGIPKRFAISIVRAREMARVPRSYEPITTAFMRPSEILSMSCSVSRRDFRRFRIRALISEGVGCAKGGRIFSEFIGGR